MSGGESDLYSVIICEIRNTKLEIMEEIRLYNLTLTTKLSIYENKIKSILEKNNSQKEKVQLPFNINNIIIFGPNYQTTVEVHLSATDIYN